MYTGRLQPAHLRVLRRHRRRLRPRSRLRAMSERSDLRRARTERMRFARAVLTAAPSPARPASPWPSSSSASDLPALTCRDDDLRRAFITYSLAEGGLRRGCRIERGHTTSAMINRYRRASRSAKKLGLGELAPSTKRSQSSLRSPKWPPLGRRVGQKTRKVDDRTTNLLMTSNTLGW